MSMDIRQEIEEEYLHFLLKSDKDLTPTYRSKVHPSQVGERTLPLLHLVIYVWIWGSCMRNTRKGCIFQTFWDFLYFSLGPTRLKMSTSNLERMS